MPGKDKFKEELETLGYNVQESPSNQGIYFEYNVEVGSNAGKKVLMGFENLKDYPLNPPHGPHFKPLDDNWINPSGQKPGTHKSKFGDEWIHWSRPFKEWNKTQKTVKEYLAHIKNILAQV